ncbi:MAG: ABC transporter ATP-binding protein [Pseudanabaena sp. ELA607]|jgi:lipopolysaccharide transport system ATP-binding protein
MSDIAIQVENLGKKYTIGHQNKAQYLTLRDAISQRAKALLAPFHPKQPEYLEEEFWALKDISFTIKQGERVGVIGRNGAGKSTLLKVLSKITEPTTGRIKIKGRVASLLEVGTGFHPELTGRENIALNGAILGMSKREINAKFDEIVAFAEVEKFLDTPVKRYSSGMYVRLAFAVAAHLEPEILIIDEVLAVGDAAFQKKCLGKMEDVSKEGRTIIFVSHSMPTITSLCQTAILLEKGTIAQLGTASEVIMAYYNTGSSSPAALQIHPTDRQIGDHAVILVAAYIKNIYDEVISEVLIDEDFKVTMHYRILEPTEMKFLPNFHFYTAEGECAFISGVTKAELLPVGEYIAECNIPKNLLNEGAYFVGLAITSIDSTTRVHFHQPNALSFNIKDPLEPHIVGRQHGYLAKIPGIVRPDLTWRVIQA